MKKIVYSVILSFVFALPTVSAQTKKNKKKIPIIRATVTVRAGLPPLPKLHAEEEADIWNEYASKKYKFKITFPAKPSDVFDDDEESAETFAGFQTHTVKALYRLAVKSLNVSLNNSQLDEKYESTFTGTANFSRLKIISKRNIYLNRKLGKEFVYKEKGKVCFLRMFVQERKLFWLTVTLPEREYTKDFDRWAMKFLESLSIETEDNQLG